MPVETSNPSPQRLLRLLIADDNPADAKLIVSVLKRAGYPVAFDVVTARMPFQQLLEQSDYDIILSDHNLLDWTGLDALEDFKKTGRNLPFVVVTGSLGDEAAVDYLKRGATDYVLKDHLERLPSVLGQALREKAHRDENARLQAQILRAKKDWELTFDSVPDPIFLIDDRHCIHRANHAATLALKMQFQQLIGKPCYEVLHGTETPPWDCPHSCLLRSGREEASDREEQQLGETFHVTCSPLRDPTGALHGCVYVMRSITERRRMEEVLHRTNDTLQSVISATPLPIFAADGEARVRIWNPAAERVFGWSKEETLGRELLTVPNDMSDQFHRMLEDVSKGQPVIDAETAYKKKDGTRFLAQVSSAALHGAEGNVSGWVSVATDITERKMLERQLREAQKMEAIGRLAGGIAHDFNNLLGVILGYVDILLTETISGDPNYVKLAQIKKAGDSAALLTRQLLAFSRNQVLQPKVLNLNAIIHEMDKLLRRVLGEDIKLVTLLDPSLGQVKADGGQIEQVVMNLVINARDAMPKGGTLTIETANTVLDYARRSAPALPGRYVTIAVSDTGIGLDAETQSHIFEPFFTTKEPGKGTGLGLATVHGIVNQSGGHITVDSQQSQGTTFKIYLPRLDEPVATEPRPEATVVGGGSETILVAEDSEMLRDFVAECLRAKGYNVLTAANGLVALEMHERYKGPIHLLLTDIVMPELGGIQLAKRFKRLRPQTKVVFMSGYSEKAPTSPITIGAVTFIDKPFSPQRLVQKVREILDERQERGDKQRDGVA